MSSATPNAPRLLTLVRDRLVLRRASPRTIEAYQSWIRRYVLFHHWRHPRELGDRELTAFLTDLANRGRVAASTQNQALAALLFLYGEVLHQPLGTLERIVRAKKPFRRPTVLSRDEVAMLLAAIRGKSQLIAALMYGGGLRIGEAIALRVKDVDTSQREITIREGKGGRDRVTMLPASLVGVVDDQVSRVRRLRGRDALRGHGFTQVPGAFAKKSPSAMDTICKVFWRNWRYGMGTRRKHTRNSEASPVVLSRRTPGVLVRILEGRPKALGLPCQPHLAGQHRSRSRPSSSLRQMAAPSFRSSRERVPRLSPQSRVASPASSRCVSISMSKVSST